MRTILVVPDPALNHDLVTALAEFPEVEVVREVAPYPEPDDFLRIIRVPARLCIHFRRRFAALPGLGRRYRRSHARAAHY
jgi:hypothetical protein